MDGVAQVPHDNRVAAGVPAGGQFAHKQHDTDAISLAATPDVIEVEIPIEWTEMVLPSNRHRNYVPTPHTANISAHVPAVAGQDAPVGFVVTMRPIVGDPYPREYRDFAGNLYTRLSAGRVENGEPVEATADNIADLILDGRQTLEAGYRASREETERHARDKLADYVAIDGEIWVRSDEPRYEIMTFGMGYNHGGTSIFTTTRCNPNLPEENYFAADDYDAAVDYAVRVATDRGDTDSLDHIRTAPRIQVLDPRIARRGWNPPTRISYRDPADLTPATFRAERKSFIDAIRTIPGAIRRRDGVQRIDLDKLTERQRRDYREYAEFAAEHGLL